MESVHLGGSLLRGQGLGEALGVGVEARDIRLIGSLAGALGAGEDVVVQVLLQGVNAETVNLEDVDLIIEYESGNKDYIATLYGMHQEGNEITKFFAGKQYSYALKVTSGEIIVSGNGIDEWDEVINLDDIIINGVEQSKSES